MSTVETNEVEAAIKAGIDALSAIVRTGAIPVLTHDWFVGTDSQCNYCNDWQVDHMVGLGHSNTEVLHRTRTAAFGLGLSGELMPNLNVSGFVFARRP